jgi:dTDP-4-dehydrorhamnose 3,5-epimerase
MIHGVQVFPLKRWDDPRGWLVEVYRHDQSDFVPAMAYMSFTKEGVARGPHEHLYQTDWFGFLWGTFKLYLWDNRPESATHGERQVLEVGERNPTAVLIPPRVVHAYKCVSPGGGLVVNLPDKLYAGLAKKQPVDEIRHEDQHGSKFSLE